MLLKSLRGEGGERIRFLLVAAILFWLFSYIVMSVRGVVLDQPLPMLAVRRLVSTLSGALLFVAAAAWLLRWAPQTLGKRIAGIAGASLVATAALFAIQAAAERIADWSPPITAGDQLGWLLMWAGYFAAWLTGTLALHAEAESVAAAIPAPEPVEERHEEEPASVLWVQRNRETVRVPVGEIEWVEAEGNYARIHSLAGSGLVRASLRSLQGQLAGEGFVRVHRSALCRKDRVRSVRRSPSGMRLVLDSGSEVPVGRAYAAELSSDLQL